MIAFGHTLLAMSGEESLAQVNREIEAPKLKNLMRAGFVIFLYSMLLTSLISFLAIFIIPDGKRVMTAGALRTASQVRDDNRGRHGWRSIIFAGRTRRIPTTGVISSTAGPTDTGDRRTPVDEHKSFSSTPITTSNATTADIATI